MHKWRLIGRRDPVTGEWIFAHMAPVEPLTDRLRRMAIEADNQGHDLREWAFDTWRQGTVLPEAVNRWIREIGEDV